VIFFVETEILGPKKYLPIKKKDGVPVLEIFTWYEGLVPKR